MAKIALLGTGKTGGRVLEVTGGHDITGFDEFNQPTSSILKEYDAAISFLPGPVLLEYIPMLIEAGLPLATGSTGLQWPEDIDEKLKKAGLAWITASNFAIGMNLIHGMIKILSKSPILFDEYNFTLHDIHHKDKKDSPSGTALSWQEWLGLDVTYKDQRIGDTVGIHELVLDSEFEEIRLRHTAKDRKIFARGAVYTAELLIKGEIAPGFHQLSEIMEKNLELSNI